MVTAERRQRDRVSVESRYYISSLESDAKRLLQATRSHWGIENRVHWVLDLSFREDESRVRNSAGGSNGVLIKATNLDVPGKQGLFDKWQEPATVQNHLADWMRLNPRGSELPMGEVVSLFTGPFPNSHCSIENCFNKDSAGPYMHNIANDTRWTVHHHE